MTSPFMTRGAKTGSSGRKAEARVAKRLKASLVPASGAMHGVKGDMAVASFLLENKSTKTGTMALTKDMLDKIAGEALSLGKDAALAFQFVNSLGQSQSTDRWVCIRESVFKDLTKG